MDIETRPWLSRRRARGPRALLALVLGLCACQNDARLATVDKPQAPVMQAILDAFAQPTAVIAPEALAALAQGIAQRTSTADTLQIDQLLILAIEEGLVQLEQNGQAAAQAIARTGFEVARQPIEVRGDGYAVITRICDGWGPTPLPDPGNGAMRLTVGFTERGLDPVVWGSLFACKYRFGEHAIELDQSNADPEAIAVRAYIGSAATLENFGRFPEPIVIDVAARVFVDGVEQLGQFSFKIDPTTRRFETLVPLPGGHAVATVALDRTSAVEVRAANGAFVCDLAAQRCSTSDGQTLEAP